MELLKYLYTSCKSLRLIRSQDKSAVRIHPPSSGLPRVSPTRFFECAAHHLPGLIHPCQAHQRIRFRHVVCLAIPSMQGTRRFDMVADKDGPAGVENQAWAILT